MADSTLPDPYVQKFLKNFEIAQINAEVDTLTAAIYGVRSYPTTLILKANGVEVDRLIGYYPPVDFVGGVVNAMSGIGTLEDLINKVSQRPQDIDLLFELGQKYRYRGDYDKAGAYFMQVIALDPANAKGKSAECAFNLAHMQYKLKNYQAAVDLFRRTSQMFPAAEIAADADLMIGYSYQKANDFKTAKKEYKAFLKKYPDTTEKEWIAEQFTKMDKPK